MSINAIKDLLERSAKSIAKDPLNRPAKRIMKKILKLGETH